jgi:hypothetical protein
MISTKELSLLEDSLKHEKLLVKKYNFYSDMCDDPEMKAHFAQIACRHQKHFDKFMGILQSDCCCNSNCGCGC